MSEANVEVFRVNHHYVSKLFWNKVDRCKDTVRRADSFQIITTRDNITTQCTLSPPKSIEACHRWIIFLYTCHVACRILVPQPGIKSVLPGVEAIEPYNMGLLGKCHEWIILTLPPWARRIESHSCVFSIWLFENSSFLCICFFIF